MLSWQERVWQQSGTFFCVFQQRVAPFYRFWQLLREKNVYRSPGNGTFSFHLARFSCYIQQRVAPFYRFQQRVAPFDHDLGLELVGSIGNFWIVAQLVHPVVEHLLNPILFSNHVSRRSLVEAEVTCILSRIWFLQFPSKQLSGYNKLEMFREEWSRSIESDRTSILSSGQDWCRPNKLRSDVSSMLCAWIVQDVVLPRRSYQDPCGFCPYDPQAERILSVCCSNLTSKYQSRIDDGMQIDCTPDMINVLEEVARN